MMRSEKGITLVALIGIMVLLVILAGVSISLVVTDGNNNEPNEVKNESVVAPIEDEVEDVETDDEVVDENTVNTEDEAESENVITNEVEDVEESDEELVTNEVEE